MKRGAMARRRPVRSLEELSLSAVGSFVALVGRRLVRPVVIESTNDPTHCLHTLQTNIRWLNSLLCQNVPRYLYDRMAIEVLRAVQGLIERTKRSYDHMAPMHHFLNEMNVVVSLTEVIVSQNLRNLDLTLWPKIMRYVIYKSLEDLSGLEVLNLGSCLGGWTHCDKFLLAGVARMPNLHTLSLCFDCNDFIVQALGEGCPRLRCLDVTSSRAVTDRSVPALLKCQQLVELQLNRTSVSVKGLARLLLGLPRLQDLGRCDDLGAALYQLTEVSPVPVLQLRRFHSRLATADHLRLLPHLCPSIHHVSLFHDDDSGDLSPLTRLPQLSDLKLLACGFYSHCLSHLLDHKGHGLTSLHLEHVEQIDLRALFHISKTCPRLKNLVLYNCDFLPQNLPQNLVENWANSPYPRVGFHNPLENSPKNSGKRCKNSPFGELERLFCVADCASLHLEFLLTNCVNIKYIHLGSSTGLGHALMAKILAANPMRNLEELRILYSADLSIRTVDLLLASCPKLRVLSELESWNGISMEELKYFREYIKRNNIDLDIRPTLSYY